MMLVSIIIPAYNRENLIVEALLSVLKQSWRPVEIIVVDDGSTDNTAEVAEAFVTEATTEGVHLHVVRGANHGSTAARNTGIKAASGECFLFLDSDDVLSHDGLASLAHALMSDKKVDFAFGKVVVGDENLQTTGQCVGMNAAKLLEDPVTYHWHTMAALYRRSILDASGGWDENSDGSDDWVFQSRVKFVAKKAYFVDMTIGVWRQHVGERLGATSFRERYTVDVTKSCAAIHNLWFTGGRLTPSIQRRLYFRALRHCWELGCFGSRVERDYALLRVREIARHSKTLWLLTAFVGFLPFAADRALYKLVSNK
jgi:glycosyltransferase involved in cell wall biosynthesis